MMVYTLLLILILAMTSIDAFMLNSSKELSTKTISSLSAEESPSGSTTRATIEFVRGLSEKVVPDVKLTRARDGSSGVATFTFGNPNCFDASTAEAGEITGMFMTDEEGEISTSDVNASFANGKPQAITSTYVMTSALDWDRFMRFMERYSDANGLGFSKA